MKKTKSKNQIVQNINHLIELCGKGHQDYRLLLNGGAYSRKTIKYSPKTKKFSITNHIDESKQKLTISEIVTGKETNIGKGILLSSLIAIID